MNVATVTSRIPCAGAIALLLALLPCGACAALTAQRAAPVSVPASGFAVFVLDSDAAGVADMDALAKALGRAGYRVTEDRLEPHDLSVRLSLKSAAASGLKEYRASLEVFAADATPTDALTEAFSAERVSDADLATLVSQIARSRGVAAVIEARRLRAARETETARSAAQALQSEEKRSRGEREAAWAGAGAEVCRVPVDPRSCNGVGKFISEHASGEHIEEAKALVAAAQPRLAALADDERFSATRPESCAAPKTEDACEAVEQYLKLLPTGLHAKEAQEARTKGASTIARLHAQAQTRAAAEARAAAARATPKSQSSDSGSVRRAAFARYGCEHLPVVQAASGACPGSFFVACDSMPDDMAAVDCRQAGPPGVLCCSTPP